MTCEACRAALAHPNEKEIASKLHAATDGPCGCEKFRLAPQSPGVVQDDETLNLILTDPQSIKDGKSPHPGVLVQIDTFGLSVLRDAASNQEFEHTIRELIQRSKERGQERFFHGVCSFQAGEVRYDGQDRFLCVYDTALPEKPHHADVFGPDLSAPEDKISKGERERRSRARIKKLLDRINGRFASVAAFRGGAFLVHGRVGDAL
jgi:hypothetical protein